MALRGLKTLVLLGLAIGLSAGAALAAAKEQLPAKAPPSVRLTLYDRTTDPMVAAIRAALKTGLKDGVLSSKEDAAAIAAYYAAQGHVPSWTADGRLTDRALLLMLRIAEAETDGLDLNDYPTPPADLGQDAPADPVALAKADLMLSQAIARYGRDAYGGRVDPASISESISYERNLPEPAAVLSNVATSSDPVATLVAYNPSQEEFQRLRERLAELRAAKTERPPAIPAGPMLKLGMVDPRVVLLRERLGVATDVENAELYDEAVVAAVKEFQAAANITADGIAGKGTLAIMNKASQDHVATVLANMEKWRWMPRYLGAFYVRVNVPDFSLEVYQDGTIVHSTRLVVGKVNNQTPIFSDEMEHIIVNPAWNVPASIALKEMLPTLQRSGGGVRGYEFFAKIRGRFRPVNPRFINWHTVDMDNIQIRQPPGERNALGAIKFMFPNRYAVYLHDTPSKALFEREQRAFSHGCMRVMDPMGFADVILAREPNGWNAARLKKLIGGPERKVDLPVHIPVHITYFTAWLDEAGNLQVRDDLYGHDGRIAAALGLTS